MEKNKTLILNTRYILRINKKEKNYQLYDTVELKIHSISYTLFFILNQFKCYPTTLNRLKVEFDKKRLSKQFADFINILSNELFPDLLIKVDNFSVDYDNFYRNKKEISPFTEYSPERIDFLITKYCNLSCKHCFENSSYRLEKPKPIDMNTIHFLFKQMDYMNIKQLKITGGEPLTIPNFVDVIKLSLKYRFQIVLLTNGILLNDELIDILKQKNALIGVSLDGVNKDIYEAMRGKETFDQLETNILKLKEAKIVFSFTTTINTANHQQIIDIATKALNFYGAQNIIFNFVNPLGRAGKNKSIFINEKNEKDVLDNINQLKDIYNERIILNVDSELVNPSNNKTIVCAAGNSIISIDQNFNVYPCIYAVGIKDYFVGSLTDETLENIWDSNKLDIFRGKIKLEDLPECNSCTFNSRCNIKKCRLKPVYEGLSFYDPISYCYKKQNIK